ncbi:hypothetical protein C1H46_004416 [Malus baccata]|uniref:Uncharacterized protein n=1 Tax=Malus baccata TaxID=106549 RepID=A0A540NG23_MALBA|nr:hypothetical protein C1H46_004416 [Malus baccata]
MLQMELGIVPFKRFSARYNATSFGNLSSKFKGMCPKIEFISSSRRITWLPDQSGNGPSIRLLLTSKIRVFRKFNSNGRFPVIWL